MATSPWWCRKMETFSTILAICEGNPPVTVTFPWQSDELWCLLYVSFNKILDTQSNCQWPETPWCSCDSTVTPTQRSNNADRTISWYFLMMREKPDILHNWHYLPVTGSLIHYHHLPLHNAGLPFVANVLALHILLQLWIQYMNTQYHSTAGLSRKVLQKQVSQNVSCNICNSLVNQKWPYADRIK